MAHKLRYSIAITFIYAVITLICVLHHEVWTDEVQVWQLCKYLNPVELINHLHNEGHPAFFYFLVMPFAKLFENIFFLQLICWLSSCFAVFLLLYFSPFKLITKSFIISGAGFLYFFPVIARSYSILPFLIFLAAILHKNRKQHIILYSIVMVLIANTHVIMFGFVSILFVFLVVDIIKHNFDKIKSSHIISAVIMFLGLLLVIFQLYDTETSNYYISFDFQNIIHNTKQVLLNFIAEAYNSNLFKNREIFSLWDYSILSIALINFFILFLNFYLNSKKIFLIAFLSIAFQLLIYIIAYPGIIYPTRIFSAYMIIVFCFWILIDSSSIDENKKICSIKLINIIISIMFLLTAYNGIRYYVSDINQNYSSAKQLAEYIKNNINSDNAVILTEHEPYILPVVYYLHNRYKLISVVRYTEGELKYIKWDYYTISVLNSMDWLNESFTYSKKYQNKDIYIIRNYIEDSNFNNASFDEYFKLLYTSDKSMLPDEKYMIYKFQKEKIVNK